MNTKKILLDKINELDTSEQLTLLKFIERNIQTIRPPDQCIILENAWNTYTDIYEEIRIGVSHTLKHEDDEDEVVNNMYKKIGKFLEPLMTRTMIPSDIHPQETRIQMVLPFNVTSKQKETL